MNMITRMMRKDADYRRLFLLLPLMLAWPVSGYTETSGSWTTIETEHACETHEEGALAAVDGKIYLLGGRKNPVVNEFDPQSKTWKVRSAAPFQMHHFQAVVLEGRIAVIGGFTGNFPRETPLSHIWFYHPSSDQWEEGPEIPEDRRRGACGVVVDGDFVYLVAGITNGHWDGHVPWLDRWNWKTGKWEILPDAPRPRDHFQAGIIDGKLVAAGGRNSSAATKQTFHLTIAKVDAFDLTTQKWETLEAEIPTQRAGCMATVYQEHLIVVGGESISQKQAHAEVEVFSFSTNQWTTGPELNQGRHGTGISQVDGILYVAAGNGDRGGGNKLTDIEMIPAADIVSSR